MNFKKYLNNRINNINIKNLYKLSDTSQIWINNIDNSFRTNKICKVNKIEDKDFAKIFSSFLNLGKQLYNSYQKRVILVDINKVKSQETDEDKFDDDESYRKEINEDYEVYNLNPENSLLGVNKNSVDRNIILEKWLKQNYCLILDKGLNKEEFIETNFLCQLSVFSFLVTEAVKNKYNNRKKSGNNISIESLIRLPNNTAYNHMTKLTNIMSEFENRNRKYIKEEEKLIYEKREDTLRFTKVFDNIYSLIWFILKWYLSYITITDTEYLNYSNICVDCGIDIEGKAKRCYECKRKHDNERRNLNRENQKNLEEIEKLMEKNTFPKKLQEEIDDLLADNPNKHTNNTKIKRVLKKIRQVVNVKKSV